MSATSENAAESKKRKRSSYEHNGSDANGQNGVHLAVPIDRGNSQASIAELEDQISESQRHYNNVATLLSLARKEAKLFTPRAPAIMSLCRVFCRLHAAGKLSVPKGASESELIVSEWLIERYKMYKRILISLLEGADSSLKQLSLALCMQLVKQEVTNAGDSEDTTWKSGLFVQALKALVESRDSEDICRTFVTEQVNSYDDVRYHTLGYISSHSVDPTSDVSGSIQQNSITILSAISVPQLKNKGSISLLQNDGETLQSKKFAPPAQLKRGQQAWLAVLSSGLSKEQRKRVLSVMTYSVVPWFRNVELLMDFLTDSYNVGGATSLLSLSGLFHLMQERNLDYPDFYTKLYSLLDHNLLQSKHRSRFFRLLHIFMSSTHLPAALVASFIKRLSRLALHAPPAGIVAVVPWVYNMLKSHPTCTFMIHREPRTPEHRADIEEHGVDDPFDMEETDPMETEAIDSCLWELETLQSHYHPNVASLAKIISEQFTKNSYNLEDFLDHSYNSLIETELGRNLKTTPVVEFEIPKNIFGSGEDTTLGDLMSEALEHL